jgi:hypothetical protein
VIKIPIIDMGQAETFEPIPAGTYDASLTDWEWIPADEVKQGKGEYGYVKMEFTIESGEYEGRKQWRNFSAAPKALGYLKRTLVALKADPENISGSFDTEDVMPDLVGNSCRIRVSMGEFEGEANNSLDRVMPAA